MKRLLTVNSGLLLIIGIIVFNPLLAQEKEKTYRVGWNYGGVHRCGESAENKKEAREAAEDKVREIHSLGFSASLVDFKIVDHDTRRWKEKDRFGITKGRKCETHLEVDVTVKIQP